MRGFFTALAALTSILSLPGLVQSASNIKGVFAHYLVVGLSSQSQADRDVTAAKNAGFDAFALNLFQVAQYSNISLDYLFTAAENQGFKLFFSLDMGSANLGNTQKNPPNQWAGKLKEFVGHSAYYRVNGRPFLSTFDGGNVNFGQSTSVDQAWQNIFRQYGLTGNDKPYFVPDFDDSQAYRGNNFFGAFPSLDGAFSWESAWPSTARGSGDVSAATDSRILNQAHNAGKVYMMPWSTLQYKHLDLYQYRKGELNFAQRIQQILDLQPDYVELISWNDGGESHNIGQIWSQNEYDTSRGFDHTGWQAMMSNLIYGMKVGATQASNIYPNNGVRIAGSAWYRTLLTTSSCTSKPYGWENGVDAVNYAFLLPSGYGQVTVKVFSNGQYIGGTSNAKAGLNMQSVTGLKVGSAPTIEVSDYLGNVFATWSGTKGVSNNGGDLCNWNYAVGSFAQK